MNHRYIVQCTWVFLFRDRTYEDRESKKDCAAFVLIFFKDVYRNMKIYFIFDE